ncbi:MAG: hypothetical protein CMJ58_23745 [Planctomycetaceae bacterium]|nr:hypothetical protein [Planctomycetaceae bacterium]
MHTIGLPGLPSRSVGKPFFVTAANQRRAAGANSMTANRIIAAVLTACAMACCEAALAESDQSPADASLVAAQALAASGNLDGAVALLRQTLPQATDESRTEILLAAARLHAQLGQLADAEQLYREVLAEPADAPLAEDLTTVVRAELATIYRRRDMWTAAAELWTELADQSNPTSIHAREAAYWLAYAEHRAGRNGQCQRRLQCLLDQAASTPGAEDDATTAPTAGRQRELLHFAQYLLSQAAIAQADWPAATAALDALRAEQPSDPLLAQAEFWRAEIAYRQGEDALARDLFAQVALRTAGLEEPWTALAPLRLAQLEAARQRWDETLLALDWLAWRWPEFELAFEADYLRGRALAGKGEFTAARAAYRRTLARAAAANTETAAMAQWMIGETFFHQQAYAEARAAYQQVVDGHEYPEWQARAALQLGQCWELQGAWEKAAETYSAAAAKYAATTSGPTLDARQQFVTRQLAVLK